MTKEESDFLRTVESIEAVRIAHGEYDEFVPLDVICSKLGIDESQGFLIASTLASRRLLLLDVSTGQNLVKSKVGHIIKALYHTTTSIRGSFVRDVSDLKYVRFTKQIPQKTIPLDKRETIDALVELMNLEFGTERDLIEKVLIALAGRFAKLSGFQLLSTKSILSMLASKSKNNSLVIVAETGAGKSLSYQLPLLLWTLIKKNRAYQVDPAKQATPTVNLTALLLFPRNVLAEDQYGELMELTDRLNGAINSMMIPTKLKAFLKIKIEKDFGGVNAAEREKIYQSHPDIIVTNPDTLKRRLMNPLASTLYKTGIDFVLYDEIHLYYGLHGANVASLNSRLQNLLPKLPVFVGMSATIANPQKHCQKLFSISQQPDLISDRNDYLVDHVTEHDVIIKPRAGRSTLGVCTDLTSSLLHNRREDTSQAHNLSNELRPKTLCFVDSLDLVGRWVSFQRNYELYEQFDAVKTQFRREYPIHFAPLSEADAQQQATCLQCKSSSLVIATQCTEYLEGRCWWFSQDNANIMRWRRIPNGTTPDDNIRVRRLTSQEVDRSQLSDIYGLFIDNHIDPRGLPIDALIATSVLEVGVDFRGIQEVIMYGEIRSPSSYKQKAGRGAREGNLSEGLFIMTIIPFSPLANFYYRHFHRLVFPSLSPLPLEPRNPDIVRSHAFCSIFDFLAINGVDVFNILGAKYDLKQIEDNFVQALGILNSQKKDVNSFVSSYLVRLGYHLSQISDIVQTALDNAICVLSFLSSNYTIGGETKKLIIWLFQAFRDMNIMATLEDEFKANLEKYEKDLKLLTESKDATMTAATNLQAVLNKLGKDYSNELNNLKELLSKIGGSL
ncbi:MAG: DEAD/DEAH box helicase [Candidatus Bathyarchaeota archaeon]|nr:DEAD/DEAH box helicase [Candidatus Bathyarchaeota archaeon]